MNFANIALDLDPTDPEDYGTGSVNCTTDTGGDVLTGIITLNGSPNAQVTAAFSGGAPVTFDLDSFSPTFN